METVDITFEAIAEDRPGEKWQALFERLWPAYKRWYLSEGLEERPTYLKCLQALRRHMPELEPTYERLCELAGGGDLAARFLSLFRPPPYISGCSQVVWIGDEPVLVRNYDYSPWLIDGLVLKTAWRGRRVIATADALWGCLDGINDDGLALSLTFGGRRAVGEGFGVPVILRYVLETCSTVEQAVDALVRIPCHMAYNVTVVDRQARYQTVYLSPDRPARVKAIPVATNHQGAVEWHRHARRTATVERERYLKFRLAEQAMSPQRLATLFLTSPLYADAYATGYGTIYTAMYRPRQGRVDYLWPGHTWTHTLDDFREGSFPVQLVDPSAGAKPLGAPALLK